MSKPRKNEAFFAKISVHRDKISRNIQFAEKIPRTIYTGDMWARMSDDLKYLESIDE